MTPTTAKLVTIIAGSEYETRLIDSLRTLGAAGYTRFEVRGRGLHGPRESSIWDGTNVQFQVLASAELAGRIMKHLGEEYLPEGTLIAYAVTVEAIPAGRFD